MKSKLKSAIDGVKTGAAVGAVYGLLIITVSVGIRIASGSKA